MRAAYFKLTAGSMVPSLRRCQQDGANASALVDVLLVLHHDLPMDLAHRRALLATALGFMRLPRNYAPREVRILARWMNSWTGVGAVVVGMAAQGPTSS